MAPREIQTLTLDGAIIGGGRGGRGGLYRTYATFHPVNKISHNLVYRLKIKK